MIGAYANTLKSLKDVCGRLGFNLLLDEDFYAELANPHGQAIILSGDRVSYPSFSLMVVPTAPSDRRRIYAVWLLMEAVSETVPADRTKPTAENQLWFLETFFSTIFSKEDTYRDKYQRLNLAEF